MASNVPLTIQTIMGVNSNSQIVIGSNVLNCDYNLKNVYWFVVVDRSDLSVKANFTASTNNVVPSQLSPYLGNSQYVLILTTQSLTSANLPQGPFYDYLLKEGAGRGLARAEQIYETLGCGSWGWMNYAYVAIMGDDTTDGFDFLEIYQSSMVTTLQFIPITVGSGTLYTPATL